MHYRIFSLLLLTFFLLLPVTAQEAAAPQLQQLFEDYFEEFLQLNPLFATSIGDNRYNAQLAIDISESHRRKQEEMARRYLAAIGRIERAALSPEDRLSYDVFVTDLKLTLESLQFPEHLLPVSLFGSLPTQLIQMGTGGGIQPFESRQDYEDFLQRLNAFPAWVDSAIANMNRGIEQGVVQSRAIIEQTLPTLQAQVVDDPKASSFYSPLRRLPRELTWEEKIRLIDRYKNAIMEAVVPAYRKLHDYLRDDYLPHTRSELGLSALPNGKDWYRFRMRFFTTTDLSPDRIFTIGEKELARIGREMEVTLRAIGYPGGVGDYLGQLWSDPDLVIRNNPKAIFAGFEEIGTIVKSHLGDQFSTIPAAPLEIRPVEKAVAGVSAAAFYNNPSADGRRPGVFYVNSHMTVYPKTQMETLYLHEALPGHHFQIALAQEQTQLPKFRRFNYYGAYIEGWGLYAESLGKELGLFHDPHQYLGHLTFELLRAARLVADVGIHDRGWSREEAGRYLSEHAFGYGYFEINRYISMPAQALSYKIGQLKISELREKAQKKLGDRFDVRAFHQAVLEDGPLPLDLLEKKVVNADFGMRNAE